VAVLSYLLLAVPLLARPWARLLAGRVDPSRATWLLTASAVMLAATSCGALGLLALAALVRLPVIAGLGSWSVSVVAHGDRVSDEVALIAGVLFCLSVAAGTRFVIRYGSALCAAFRLARSLRGGDVVVTTDAHADAYAVPGWPGRVVVSRGMLDALDREGREALIAHERAHVSGRHFVFGAAVRLAAAFNPLLRPFVSAVDYTVERWADERAAAHVGDRRLVAATIARAALAAKASRAQRSTPLALGVVSRSLPGPVPRRVVALLAGPPRRHLTLMVICLAAIGLMSVCAILAANDLQDLLSLAHARVN
jgi:Zn-dependent protease with chaperone function